MEAADWRLESVFERVYYKPANSYQIGYAVLSTSSIDSLYHVDIYVIQEFQNEFT